MKLEYVLYGSEVCSVISQDLDRQGQPCVGMIEFWSEGISRYVVDTKDKLLKIPTLEFKNASVPITAVKQGMMVHADDTFYFVKNIHKTNTGEYVIKVNDIYNTFFKPEEMEIIQ